MAHFFDLLISVGLLLGAILISTYVGIIFFIRRDRYHLGLLILGLAGVFIGAIDVISPGKLGSILGLLLLKLFPDSRSFRFIARIFIEVFLIILVMVYVFLPHIKGFITQRNARHR